MKMCQALAGEGHQTTLIVPPRRKGRLGGVDDVYAFYGVARNFRIIKTLWVPKAGVYIHGFISAVKAKFGGTDIFYTRSMEIAFFSCLLRNNTIFETHTPLTEFKYLDRLLLAFVLRSDKVKTFVVISDALKKLLLEAHAINASRVLVAHDGSDIAKNITNNVNDSNISVGYVGHLYKGRGIEVIIEAAQSIPAVNFHVVGGNPEDVKYWEKNSSGIKNLTFYGFVSPQKAAELSLKMDILLAPYQETVMVTCGLDTSKWMSPLKIFEYMAAGKAIICSDIPVLREVLEHERNALLCKPADHGAWVASIKRLISDQDLRLSISSSAYQDTKTKYSWSIRAKNVIDSIL
jgi:glycosyltransferase involved in cell wall biosynthesis